MSLIGLRVFSNDHNGGGRWRGHGWDHDRDRDDDCHRRTKRHCGGDHHHRHRGGCDD